MASDWGFFLHKERVDDEHAGEGYHVGAADHSLNAEDRSEQARAHGVKNPTTGLTRWLRDSDAVWAYFFALHDCSELIEERGAWALSYEEGCRLMPELLEAERFWQGDISSFRLRRALWEERYGKKWISTSPLPAWNIRNESLYVGEDGDGYGVWAFHLISGAACRLGHFSNFDDACRCYDALDMLERLLKERASSCPGKFHRLRRIRGQNQVDMERSWKKSVTASDADNAPEGVI